MILSENPLKKTTWDPIKKKLYLGYNDDEDDHIDPKQHYAELVEDARTMMKRVMRTPKEAFPEFLWDPGQNDFTDEGFVDNHLYIEIGLGRIEKKNGVAIMQAASHLKSRYKNYFDYIDALAVWQDYREFIEDIYGDFRCFSEMVEAGQVNYPLKNKPKLKNAKKNRHLLEIKVPISRINPDEIFTDEQFKQLGDAMGPQIEIYDDYYEWMDICSEINVKEEQRIRRKERIRNYRKTSAFGDFELNTINKYLSGDGFMIYNDGITYRPLSEDLEAMHEFDGLNEDLKRDAMGLRHKSYVNPEYKIITETGQTEDEVDVYSTLAANGWDINGMLSSATMDKKSMKAIRRAIPGLEEEMSPKKAKKLKKRRKRYERVLYETLSANEEVRNIMTKNRITFSPEDNMLSFTIDNALSNKNESYTMDDIMSTLGKAII